MNGKIAGIFSFLAFLLSFYGCATVPAESFLSGQVTVSSHPAWAEFRVVGDPTIYNTPYPLPLTHTGPYIVRVEKDGYEPVLLRINVFSTISTKNAEGIPCNWNVEALSEAQYRVAGDMVIVVLKESPQPALPPVLASPPQTRPEVSLMQEPKPKKSLKQRIRELDILKKKGKISAKQYKALKKKAAKEYKF